MFKKIVEGVLLFSLSLFLAGSSFAKQPYLRASKILGAQFLVAGAITEFESKQSGVGAGAISFKGITIGGKKYIAKVGLDLRIFDVNTSEIIASENVTEQVVTTKLVLGAYYKGIAFGGESFNKTPIGQATRKAIEKAVKIISEKLEPEPWQGKVVLVKNNLVYINAGSSAGLKKGYEFTIYSPGEELVDPDTGLSLGFIEEKVGKVKVVKVSEKFSVAKIVEGNVPKRGDIVKPVGGDEQLKGLKKRIAVASFENKVAHVWWNEGAWKIGRGVQDMLITALAKSGKFVVLERDELEKAIKEQELSQKKVPQQKEALNVSQSFKAEGGFIVVRQRGGELFFDDFSLYGTGRVAPFGPWTRIKDQPAHIEEGIQPDGTTGKICVIGGDRSGIFTSDNFSDVVLEVNAKPDRGIGAIFFRVSSDGLKGYYIKSAGEGPVELWKFAGGTSQKIAQSAYIKTNYKWVYYRIEAKKGRITVYFNGNKVIDIVDDDPSLSSGGIGLGSRGGVVYYDNVRVGS